MQIGIEEKDVVIDIVKHASELAKSYLQKGFSSHSKGGMDFATEADDAVDAFLREHLAKQFPETIFLTEETAPDDYLSFKDAENLWIIDPIDGTTNFSRGSDHFAISVALVSKGVSQLGVVSIPLEHKLYWAVDGVDDAILNDQSISVSSVPSLSQALVCCDWSWVIPKRQEMHTVLGKVITKVRACETRGSAVSDLASLASGNIDAYFVFGTKPWDIAASSLFLLKAGGKITRFDGSVWNIFDADFVATNGLLHEELLGLIKS